MVRALFALMLSVLLLAACGDDCESPGDASGLPTLRAEAWPEADALFQSDPRWLGGDAAYTVDLGDDRVLWLFGDSFIATSASRLRSESVMVRNSVAVQTGRDPSQAEAAFYWREPAGPQAPEAFFDEPLSPETWLWPLDGLRVGDTLLLFFTRVAPAEGGLGFEGVDWQARLVSGLAQAPEAWTVTAPHAPPNPWRIFLGTAVTVADGYVLAYGMQDLSHDLFVHRWPLAVAAAGLLDQGEWWCGDGTWSVTCEPGRLLEGVAAELSVHRDPGSGWWLLVESLGFGQTELGVRLALDPLGPWSASEPVYRPAEWDWTGAFMYAGKGHPELEGADAVLTYVVNNFDFGTLVSDSRYYFPRFVRLTVTAAH